MGVGESPVPYIEAKAGNFGKYATAPRARKMYSFCSPRLLFIGCLVQVFDDSKIHLGFNLDPNRYRCVLIVDLMRYVCHGMAMVDFMYR